MFIYLDMEQDQQKKKYPRAQKFARLIKKGRNGQVKFQAYRKTPNFKRSKRSLLKIKRNPKVQIKSKLESMEWWVQWCPPFF